MRKQNGGSSGRWDLQEPGRPHPLLQRLLGLLMWTHPGTLGRLLGVQVFCDLEGREMVKMGVLTIRQPEQPRRMPRSHPHPSPAPCVPGSLRVKAKGIVRLVS